MKRHFRWLLPLLLVAGFIALLPSSVTIVPIADVEAQALAEEFDPVAFVDSIWSTQLLPAVTENAVDLALILNQFEVDDKGLGTKEQLTAVATEMGSITVGEAHVYLVKGEGVVTAVDTESRSGAMTLQLAGYDGPIVVKIFAGGRIPSDETSVRDAVGFIQFGDFKEQTEYGKVASELNKRVVSDVLDPLDKAALVGKQISFHGAFGIRTFNLINIDLSEITVVPVQISVQE